MTMKAIRSAAIMLFSVLVPLASCAKTDPLFPDTPVIVPPGETSDPEEVEFRGLVYIDKASMDGHLGGERVVRQKMDRLFADVTEYWNESARGRLDFRYRYVVGDIVTYDCGSNDPELNRKVYNDPMDFGKYDFVVLFDAMQDHDDDRGEGGAHGGGSDHRSVITIIAGAEPKDLFDETTRNTLTHELGHYRGVTDLYQYQIDAKNNPVSNETFDGTTCIMNWAAAGVWSDYAVGCMNLAGPAKQIGKEFDNFFNSLYPDDIEFVVTVDGKPRRGIDIELYASRAGASDHPRDIYGEVYCSGRTSTDGRWVLKDVVRYFIPSVDKELERTLNVPPSLSYGRCFGFLAKVIYNDEVKYVWMSEEKVQMSTLEGKDIFTVNVSF